MIGVHEVFHVSMLRKYTPDPAHVVDWGQIEVDTDGTFEEGPVCILDSRDQVLRSKTVRLVRVLWRHGSCACDTAGWHPRHDAYEATTQHARVPGRACVRRLGVLAGSAGPSWCTIHLAQF